jgi:hypothetical protein
VALYLEGLGPYRARDLRYGQLRRVSTHRYLGTVCSRVMTPMNNKAVGVHGVGLQVHVGAVPCRAVWCRRPTAMLAGRRRWRWRSPQVTSRQAATVK